MIAECQSAIRNLQSGTYYGVVAKWQGKGLQNPHHGFKSHRRLNVIDDCGLMILDCQSAICFINDVSGTSGWCKDLQNPQHGFPAARDCANPIEASM